MNLAAVQEPWTIAFLIVVAALIFGYLYFRRKPGSDREERTLQQVELKLKQEFSPSEITLTVGRPARILIHRFDTEPADELFEIAELEIYELLPAGHTTIIAFLPEKTGRFYMVLGGERRAGVVHVTD